jgi:phenylalanyl-tRNA synthetase alpha subunit
MIYTKKTMTDANTMADGARVDSGHLHPITQIMNEINKIFAEIGFQVAS